MDAIIFFKIGFFFACFEINHQIYRSWVVVKHFERKFNDDY